MNLTSHSIPHDMGAQTSSFLNAAQSQTPTSRTPKPLLGQKTTHRLTQIAITLIDEAQRQGCAIFQTHKKDADLFSGRKTHSYTLPDGTCHLFVKQKATAAVAAKAGTYKDMLPAEHFVYDPKAKAFQRLHNVARLRFFYQGRPMESTTEAEIEFLQQLKGHKNIVELIAHGTYVKQTSTGTKNKTVMYQQLCDMNLTEFITSGHLSNMRPSRRVNVILSIAEQMLRAINYAHANDIVVNDFKTTNILVKLRKRTPPDIVLTDFGLSKYSSEINSTINHGIAQLISPENCLLMHLINQNASQDPNADFYIQPTLGKPLDIWAAGIALFQLEKGAPFTSILPAIFLCDTFDINEKYMKFLIRYDFAVRQHTNTIPVPAEVTDPIKVAMQKVIIDGHVMLDTLKSITFVSNPLQPFYADTPEYDLYTIANQWSKDYIAILGSLITLCQRYPQATRQDNLKAVFSQSTDVSGFQLAVSKKMMQDYFQVLEKLPIPPMREDPINHLIHKMLQPNAAKRITASETLQVIQEYRADQASSTRQHSGRKRDHASQDKKDSE